MPHNVKKAFLFLLLAVVSALFWQTSAQILYAQEAVVPAELDKENKPQNADDAQNSTEKNDKNSENIADDAEGTKSQDADEAQNPAEESDEDFENIFDDAEDTIADNTDTDYREQFTTGDKITVSRSFSATGGTSFGWKDGMPDYSDLGKHWGADFGATAQAKLSFSAKPDSSISIAGGFYTSIQEENDIIGWIDIQIDDLYLDYNLLDTAFFRVGKYHQTWGQGRLFTPGNLLSGIESNIAMRISFPIVADGLTFVTYTKKIAKSNMTFAALAEKVIGDVHLSVGGRFRDVDTDADETMEGGKALLSLKTVLFTTDLYTDLVLHQQKIGGSSLNFSVLAGFYKEIDDLRLCAEYYYNGETAGNNQFDDHNLGLFVWYKNIFSTSIDAGVEWKHSFFDNSGRVTPGIVFSPWKHVTFNFGFPIVYGGSYTPQSDYEKDEQSDAYRDKYQYIPKNEGIYCLLSIVLSTSF